MRDADVEIAGAAIAFGQGHRRPAAAISVLRRWIPLGRLLL